MVSPGAALDGSTDMVRLRSGAVPVPEHILELRFGEVSHLHEVVAEPAVVAGGMLLFEGGGQGVGIDQAAADQNVAERFPDGARGRVHDPAEVPSAA